MDVDETQEYGGGQDLKTAFEKTAIATESSPVKEAGKDAQDDGREPRSAGCCFSVFKSNP